MALLLGAGANFSPHRTRLVRSSKTLSLLDRLVFKKPVISLFYEYLCWLSEIKWIEHEILNSSAVGFVVGMVRGNTQTIRDRIRLVSSCVSLIFSSNGSELKQHEMRQLILKFSLWVGGTVRVKRASMCNERESVVQTNPLENHFSLWLIDPE